MACPAATYSTNRSIWSVVLLVVNLALSVQSFRTTPISIHSRKGQSGSSLLCKTGGLNVDSQFLSPDSVSAMMKDVAEAIIAARDARVSLALVDVPVPVTGKYLRLQTLLSTNFFSS
jgi:hypothetical protein